MAKPKHRPSTVAESRARIGKSRAQGPKPADQGGDGLIKMDCSDDDFDDMCDELAAIYRKMKMEQHEEDLSEQDRATLRRLTEAAGDPLFNAIIEKQELIRQVRLRRQFIEAAREIAASPHHLAWLGSDDEFSSLIKDLNDRKTHIAPARMANESSRLIQDAVELLEFYPNLVQFARRFKLDERLKELFAWQAPTDAISIPSDQGRADVFRDMVSQIIDGLQVPDIRDYLIRTGSLRRLDAYLDELRDKTSISRPNSPLTADRSPLKLKFDKPVLTVLGSIGDPDSSEGKVLTKAYEKLTKPMPLATLNMDVSALQTALELEFPSFESVIDQVCSELRLRRSAGVMSIKLRPILLIGKPGLGKTRFAQKLAKLLDCGYGAISAAGADDSRILTGTSRGWGNRTPSFPILTISQVGKANPIIVVDEIDKVANNPQHGRLTDVLLSFLEPQTAARFPDDCLLGNCDLSQVSWVLTANDISRVSTPLLSRCRVFVIEQSMPDPERMLNQIRSDIAEELGVSVDALPELEPETKGALGEALSEGLSIRRVKALMQEFLGQDSPQPSPRKLH